MSYPTMCCEVESRKDEVVTCEGREVPLAQVMKDTDGELYETRQVLASIIVRLINAPKPDENKEIVNSFTDQVISVNRQAYDARCLSKRIEQLLFGGEAEGRCKNA